MNQIRGHDKIVGVRTYAPLVLGCPRRYSKLMAIYHFNVSHVSRSTGRSSVQSAAYITGATLYDARHDRDVSYKRGTHEVYAWEVLAPENAPEVFKTLEGWNELETFEDAWAEKYYKNPKALEHHKNSARISMNIIAALPRELTLDQSQALVEEFVTERFVKQGHYVLYGIHDEEGNPHVHMMVSHRYIDEKGQISTHKNRDLCSIRGLKKNRQAWAAATNKHLELNGREERVTDASFIDLDMGLIPSLHEGPHAQNLAKQGEFSFIVDQNHRIREENQNRILEKPELILDYMTKMNATFTMPQLLSKIGDFFPGNEKAISYVYHSIRDKLILLGEDVSATSRFTSAEYQAIESQAVETFEKLKDNSWGQEISQQQIAQEIELVNRQLQEESNTPDARLNPEQEAAIYGICRPDQMSVLVGRAGAGKTTSMRAIKTLYETNGYRVVGAALSAAAAKNLGDDTGCFSETVRFYIHRWEKLDQAKEILAAKGEDRQKWTAEDRAKAEKTLHFYSPHDLTDKSVLIVDEASMIGTRDWHKILERVHAQGSKLVMVGDGRQFSAVEAGDIHRYMEDNIRPESRFILSDINRQKVPFMKEASLELSNQNIHTALAIYERHGHIQPIAEAAEGKEASYQALYQQVAQDYVRRILSKSPNGVILAYTNEMCHHLNHHVRQALKAEGVLFSHNEVPVLGLSVTEGDQIVFLSPHRSNKGVEFFDTSKPGSPNVTADNFIRNGTRGEILAIEACERVTEEGDKLPFHRLTIQISDRLTAVVDSDHFKPGDMAYGYAVTTHKAQGQTLDWVLVVASKFMSAAALYVALTRHRFDTRLYYSEADYPSFAKLQHVLARASYKDMAIDYAIQDQNRPYFDNVETYRLITLEMADMIANNDIYGDGEAKERMQALENERAEVGEQILAEFDKHALYAAQAKLTREQIEITCGVKERPLSRAEEVAKQRVLSYITLAQECRQSWEGIKADGVGEKTLQHPAYKDYDQMRQTRDALALEIHLNKALHRPFMREIGAALNYGFKVIEKQAVHAIYRQEFEANKQFLTLHLERYQSAAYSPLAKEFWKSPDYQAKGEAAMELLAYHLTEKAQDFPKLTFLYLKEKEVDFRALSQLAHDYNSFGFARGLQDPRDREQAEKVIAYSIANRHASEVFKQCAAEIDAHNSRLTGTESNKLSFWHAPSYELYQQACMARNGLAYELSAYDAHATQALGNLFKVALKNFAGHQHMGELHHLCQAFKNAKTLQEKAPAAYWLMDWLAVDQAFKDDSKELAGGVASPTYRAIQWAQLDWAELSHAASLHKIDLSGHQLTASQQALAESVFHYTKQRRLTGAAWKLVIEDHTARLKAFDETADPQAKKPTIAQADNWPTYAAERERLDQYAAILFKADPTDLHPLKEVFRLKDDQLRHQAHRHDLHTAIGTVLKDTASLADRAAAYLFIEQCRGDGLDRQLKALEKKSKVDLQDLYSHLSKDIVGLIFHNRSTPKEFDHIGSGWRDQLKKEDPTIYQSLMTADFERKAARELEITQVLAEAHRRLPMPSDSVVESQTRLEAKAEYEAVASTQTLPLKKKSQPVFRTAKFYEREEVMKVLTSQDMERIFHEHIDKWVDSPGVSRARDELRFGKKGGFVVNLKSGEWFSHYHALGGDIFKYVSESTNKSYKEAIQELGEMTRASMTEKVYISQDKRSQEFEEKNKADSERLAQGIQKSKTMWEKSIPLQGTVGEHYLRHVRGITAELPDDIRFIPYRKVGDRVYAALISFARNREGQITGYQEIYLNPQTGEKAKELDVVKRSGGYCREATVQLQHGKGSTFIAEGLETALSLKSAGIEGEIRSGYGRFCFKNSRPRNNHIVLCADYDGPNSVTHKALQRDKEVLETQGYAVSILWPAQSGEQKVDFNDVLKNQGASAIKEMVETQITKQQVHQEERLDKSLSLQQKDPEPSRKSSLSQEQRQDNSTPTLSWQEALAQLERQDMEKRIREGTGRSLEEYEAAKEAFLKSFQPSQSAPPSLGDQKDQKEPTWQELLSQMQREEADRQMRLTTGKSLAEYEALKDEFLKNYGGASSPVSTPALDDPQTQARSFTKLYHDYKLSVVKGEVNPSQEEAFKKQVIEFSKNEAALFHVTRTNPQMASDIAQMAKGYQQQLEREQSQNQGFSR